MATVVEGDFEWDEAKARANVDKHGVSFAEGATVFADPNAVYLDDGSGTERMVVIGTSIREYCMSFTLSAARGIASSALAVRRSQNEMSTRAEFDHESGS